MGCMGIDGLLSVYRSSMGFGSKANIGGLASYPGHDVVIW